MYGVGIFNFACGKNRVGQYSLNFFEDGISVLVKAARRDTVNIFASQPNADERKIIQPVLAVISKQARDIGWSCFGVVDLAIAVGVVPERRLALFIDGLV